ncbi:MAG: methyl-accepting chemotaxis protein [Rhodoferax sp.]|uniref:methyl-accepting chemotaxis protein n=1 Tax=Rhodoferax sp. TaxID=50421 RepID=UPI002614A791|nr:methyl-accepting chemotaxis protein [Rhodoferax sp.]MDD2882599.1 methyl-accepting chemotaxis protein [Rhodoferax sp.]
MKPFSHMNMAARLTFGFGVILAMMLGMATLSLLRMQALTSALEVITVTNAERAQTINVMKRQLATYVQTLGDLGSTDLAGGPAVLKRIRAAQNDYNAAQTKVAGLLPADTTVQAVLTEVQNAALAATELQTIGDKLAEGRGEAAQAFQVRNEYGKDTATWSARQQAWSKAVYQLSDWHDQTNATHSAQATATAKTARQTIMAGALLAWLLGSLIAVWLVHDTRKAIHAAVAATARMAQHDLSQAIDTGRQDEIGALLVALETMRVNLHKLATGVGTASEDVNNSSGEIAQGSMDLSDRTEEAANTLQTAMAAISQLNASVNETTTASRSAESLTQHAVEVAKRSGNEMTLVVATMGEIDTAAHKIADIISLIDGIAFQTNILALNAAVEAARAGEQGRGFAVVASEVRSLAGRTTEAAKEIKMLIEASLNKVQSGTAQVNKAGNTTHEVTASVQRVSDTVNGITAQASDQLLHIEQANQLIGQLDVVAHQNAALAEESAAAAASLRQQASHLSGLVHQFQLGSPSAQDVAAAKTAQLA